MNDPFRPPDEAGESEATPQRPVAVVPVSPPTVLMPVAVVPSGSEPGEVCAVDLSRSVLAGVASYGVFAAIAKVLGLLGLYSPAIFGHYGAELAAVFTSVSALIIAWTRDNQASAAVISPPVSSDERADRDD